MKIYLVNSLKWFKLEIEINYLLEKLKRKISELKSDNFSHIKIAFGLIGENWGGENFEKVWDKAGRESMIIVEQKFPQFEWNLPQENSPKTNNLIEKFTGLLIIQFLRKITVWLHHHLIFDIFCLHFPQTKLINGNKINKILSLILILSFQFWWLLFSLGRKTSGLSHHPFSPIQYTILKKSSIE